MMWRRGRRITRQCTGPGRRYSFSRSSAARLGAGPARDWPYGFSPEASVIRYSPPKSQVWGHQVGRLTATAVVERCLSFLDSHCSVINSGPSELMIAWNDGPAAHVTEEVVADVDRTLGQPTAVNEMPSG